MAPQRKHYGFAALVALATIALGAGACDRQSGVETSEHEGAAEALERAESGGEESGAEPLPGVDLGDLDDAEKARFDSLADALSSPCGEAHSLRTSALEDEDCRRSVHAGRYVAQLIADGASDTDVRQFYDERYAEDTVHDFDGEDVPRKGPSDARIEIVEFIDYGCPHCKKFGAVLDRAQQAWPTDVALYIRFFPLGGNPNGVVAAQAAIAAMRQDKFEEMHEKLFENQGRHDPQSLRRYAEEIGLDMAQYAEDFEAAEARVERDRQRGSEIGVRATPTVFVNGRRYTDPDRFEYVKLWIEEELAVNR